MGYYEFGRAERGGPRSEKTRPVDAAHRPAPSEKDQKEEEENGVGGGQGTHQ